MAITINGNGTVTGVSVGGLPDGIVDADMIAAEAVTSPKIGNGGIIQVKQTIKTNAWSDNDTSYVDITGLNVTIQPTTNSNKILIRFCVHMGHNAATQHVLQLVRLVSGGSDVPINPATYFDATAMFYGSAASGAEAGWERNILSYEWLDSPTTTDSITYRLRTKVFDASATQYVNRPHSTSDLTGSSTITAMEVVA